MSIPVEVLLPRRWRILRSTYRRDLPSSFAEVPEARRLPLWLALNSKPGEAGRLAAMRYLIDLPNKVFKQLTDDQVFSLLEVLPWLEAMPDPNPRINSFNHHGILYHLPANHGLNMVAIEYPIADEAFMRWAKTGSPEAIKLLCGTLCREANPDEADAILRGDKRVPLVSRSQAEHRAEAFKDLPEAIETAVLLYFAGVKEFISNSYGKVLFDQDDEGDQSSGSTSPTLGWWSVYFSVAADGPFGDIQALYQTSFHSVCLYLVDRIKQQRADELRRRMSSGKFAEHER